MKFRIENLPKKKLVGKRMKMSFLENKTGELWRGFMPRLREINNSAGEELYSVEVYRPHYFDAFDPGKVFDKWAAIEVVDFDTVPEGMETIILPGGTYAVFKHRGPASEGSKTFGYIFGSWLPNSDFSLDERPHFAVMGDKYKHESPDSEEEIWIPVKSKNSSQSSF
jgi:AraC family transcriptional regulator